MAFDSPLFHILKDKSPQTSLAEKFWSRLDQTNELTVDQALMSYTGAAKRLGKEVINWSDLEKNEIEKVLSISIEGESFSQLVRVAFLTEFPNHDFIAEILRRGDDNERAAAIKAINQIDPNGQFADLVIDCCRSNSTIIFAAISQNNPYPAKFFPDLHITHLALKTIFMDLDFSLILGLDERVSDNLKVALTDLYEERLAAGRTIPDEAISYMKKHQWID